MPTMETYAIKPTDLEGNVGVAVYGLKGGEMGMVDAPDDSGTLHRVAAKLGEGDVPKGEDVILVRYHRERDYYDVSKSPL
jgi:hypothetical protein